MKLKPKLVGISRGRQKWRLPDSSTFFGTREAAEKRCHEIEELRAEKRVAPTSQPNKPLDPVIQELVDFKATLGDEQWSMVAESLQTLMKDAKELFKSGPFTDPDREDDEEGGQSGDTDEKVEGQSQEPEATGDGNVPPTGDLQPPDDSPATEPAKADKPKAATKPKPATKAKAKADKPKCD